jgi:cytochrome c biogenesis protein CcmG/thiol:disulfide interchange protein DsbE
MNRVARSLFFALLTFALIAVFSGCTIKTPSAPASGAALQDEPSITFNDLQGNHVTLASMKGKVVLVNFWATWCEPCRGEIPILIGMQTQYGAKGFTTLGVAMDEEGKKVVDPYVHTTQFNVAGQPSLMNYPIVLGSDDIATQFGGLLGMPTSYLINRDGKIAKKYVGALNEAQIKKDVETQL